MAPTPPPRTPLWRREGSILFGDTVGFRVSGLGFRVLVLGILFGDTMVGTQYL